MAFAHHNYTPRVENQLAWWTFSGCSWGSKIYNSLCSLYAVYIVPKKGSRKFRMFATRVLHQIRQKPSQSTHDTSIARFDLRNLPISCGLWELGLTDHSMNTMKDAKSLENHEGRFTYHISCTSVYHTTSILHQCYILKKFPQMICYVWYAAIIG